MTRPHFLLRMFFFCNFNFIVVHSFLLLLLLLFLLRFYYFVVSWLRDLVDSWNNRFLIAQWNEVPAVELTQSQVAGTGFPHRPSSLQGSLHRPNTLSNCLATPRRSIRTHDASHKRFINAVLYPLSIAFFHRIRHINGLNGLKSLLISLFLGMRP